MVEETRFVRADGSGVGIDWAVVILVFLLYIRVGWDDLVVVSLAVEL